MRSSMLGGTGDDEPALRWTCEFFRAGIQQKGWHDPHELGQVVATLAVDFDDRGNVIGAHLTKPGLTGSELARFPWSRWVTAATHFRKAHLSMAHDAAVLELADGALTAGLTEQRQRRRPGRGGHPIEFYEVLAKQYSGLVATGVKNPVQALTDEAAARGEHVSRDTVAGWVKRARQLGLLPPGRGRTDNRKGNK